MPNLHPGPNITSNSPSVIFTTSAELGTAIFRTSVVTSGIIQVETPFLSLNSNGNKAKNMAKNTPMQRYSPLWQDESTFWMMAELMSKAVRSAFLHSLCSHIVQLTQRKGCEAERFQRSWQRAWMKEYNFRCFDCLLRHYVLNG